MIDPPDGVWKRRKKRENVEQGKIEQFKEAVAQCNSIVFFGGAGVSTESGIPDFRRKAFPPGRDPAVFPL